LEKEGKWEDFSDRAIVENKVHTGLGAQSLDAFARFYTRQQHAVGIGDPAANLGDLLVSQQRQLIWRRQKVLDDSDPADLAFAVFNCWPFHRSSPFSISRAAANLAVMPALVAGIHVFLPSKGVDGRDKGERKRRRPLDGYARP
jgi:hypothetical protein